jgi:hypothetical protein
LIDDYQCDCGDSGYTGERCETAIQNCAQTPCLNDGACTNAGNSRTCNCTGTGYQGSSCEVDINECDEDPCDPLTDCRNNNGGFTCTACPSGYTGNGLDGCTNVDECLTNNGGCDPLTMCMDMPGTRICTACPAGYTGSGATGCVNIDECLTNNGGCDPLSKCTDGPGTRMCGPCPTGYTGSGETGCTDINECSPSPCRNGGVCSQPMPGTYSCACVDGWMGATCSNKTITLDASSRGFYSNDWWPAQTGWTNSGRTLTEDIQFRTFFVFDIPSFTGTINSLSLRLWHHSYDSGPACETFRVWDVTTSIASLNNVNGTESDWLPKFTDLGSGTYYHSGFSLCDSTVGSVVSATLNSSAITKVSNTRGGEVAFGVALSTVNVGSGTSEFITFSEETEARTHQLQITVVP